MLEEASVRCPPLSAESVPSLSFCEQECLGLLLGALKPENHSVCNNAAWAIGEVTAKVGPAIAPYVSAILQHLILIITRPAHEVRRFRLLASLGQSRCRLFTVHRRGLLFTGRQAAPREQRHHHRPPWTRRATGGGSFARDVCGPVAADVARHPRRRREGAPPKDVASLPRGSSTFVETCERPFFMPRFCLNAGARLSRAG